MCAIKSVVIDLVKICLNEIFVRKIATRGVMGRRLVLGLEKYRINST